MRLGTWEIAAIVLIVLLLFGTTRLPKLARSLREAKDEFQKGSEEKKAETEAPSAETTPPDAT